MGIFHGYVSLPEGNCSCFVVFLFWRFVFVGGDILHQLSLGSLSHHLPRLLYIADGIGVQQIEYSWRWYFVPFWKNFGCFRPHKRKQSSKDRFGDFWVNEILNLMPLAWSNNSAEMASFLMLVKCDSGRWFWIPPDWLETTLRHFFDMGHYAFLWYWKHHPRLIYCIYILHSVFDPHPVLLHSFMEIDNVPMNLIWGNQM